jgi:2-iminoacetate synthase ThiH
MSIENPNTIDPEHTDDISGGQAQEPDHFGDSRQQVDATQREVFFGLPKKENIDALVSDIDRLIQERIGLLEEPDEHEHIVDINHPEIRRAVERCESVFWGIIDKYGYDFDLSKSEKIDPIIQELQKAGILDLSAKVRELIYDHNISIYGVSYLSNFCNQNCSFCPIGVANLEIYQLGLALQQGKIPDDQVEDTKRKIASYKAGLRTLTTDEARQDFEALRGVGHTEICILAGEEIGADIVRITDYINVAAQVPGIKEIILNMGNYPERVFRLIRQQSILPPGVRLQHRVFQETYLDRYMQFMKNAPKDRSALGMGDGKVNFFERYDSQAAALQAGFDEVGIGALFGLSSHPLLEVKGLYNHNRRIKESSGKEAKRCALPIGNEPDYVNVEIPHKITGLENQAEITETIYALARLAMPTVSIVSSERDGEDMLRTLDRYANHTTLFVHPGPGRNVSSLNELSAGEGTQTDVIEQAKVTSRFPRQAILDWHKRGYHVLGFDWQKYVPEEAANRTKDFQTEILLD